VDHEGGVLEVFAAKRRDRKAALKFIKRAKALWPTAGDRHGSSPLLRRCDEDDWNRGSPGMLALSQ